MEIRVKIKDKKDSHLHLRKWERRDRLYNKYKKTIRHILRANVGNSWNDIYSKLCETLPREARYLINMFIDYKQGNLAIYKSWRGHSRVSEFVPSTYKRPYYYIENGTLKVIQPGPKVKHGRPWWYDKNIPKKEYDPFKFDVDITASFDGRASVVTNEEVLEDGTVKKYHTSFTIPQLIDWCERHYKTYRIKEEEYKYCKVDGKYTRTYNNNRKTIEKRSYDI